MAEIERIPFEFNGDGILADAEKLEGILCSGHWSDRTLNYKDERTKLLLRLLQIGGVAVYKREYTPMTDASPEIRRRANELNMFMNKRNVSQMLLDIANIFFSHEYDGAKTIYNALFFPALKAYVRCGGLPPDRLLELLEQDGCEAVMLFPDIRADAGDEDIFYIFMLAMPKDMYLDTLGEMREQIAKTIYEAMRKMEEKKEHITPPYSMWTETE